MLDGVGVGGALGVVAVLRMLGLPRGQLQRAERKGRAARVCWRRCLGLICTHLLRGGTDGMPCGICLLAVKKLTLKGLGQTDGIRRRCGSVIQGARLK